MDIEYDSEARTLYLRIRQGEVARTERIDPQVLIDRDAAGRILGVELLALDAAEQRPDLRSHSETRLAVGGAPEPQHPKGELPGKGTRSRATENPKTSPVHGDLGASFDRLFDELAEEAEVYTKLLGQLKHTPIGEALRDDLEGELYGSLAHLATHAALLLDAVDEALNRPD